MKRTVSFTLAAAIVTTLAGCATSSAPTPELPASGDRSIDASKGALSSIIRLAPDVSARTDSIGAPVDVVWNRLQSVYARLGIPVTTVDSASHTVGAVRAEVRGRLGAHRMSDVLDCGSEPTGGQRADSYPISLTAVTSLEARGGATRARTSVQASSRDPNGTSGNLQCGSRGVIESDIAAALAKP